MVLLLKYVCTIHSTGWGDWYCTVHISYLIMNAKSDGFSGGGGFSQAIYITNIYAFLFSRLSSLGTSINLTHMYA